MQHYFSQIAGIDEAGRGPLAGPVVASAVVFQEKPLCLLADSKSLTPQQRVSSFKHICQCHHWAIGIASAKEIDRINIRQATLLAMQRALHLIQIPVTKALIDGRDTLNSPIPQEAVIKGDQTIPVIQAASIVAKVYRDALMAFIARLYPEYGFDQHKGYGTAQHRHAITAHGPCSQHRYSFSPIREMACSTI